MDKNCAQAVPELLTLLQKDAAAPVDDILFGAAAKQSCQITVDIQFINPPRAHRVPFFAELAHPIYGDTNICLVVPPPQTKVKDELLEATEQVASRVEKVIDTKKLKAKYADPVALRALAKSFGLFVVMGPTSYPTLLTGEFLNWHTPVWVKNQGLEKGLLAAERTTVISRRGYGNITVPVGNTGMKTAQILENISALMEQLKTILPEGLDKDVLSIAVSSTSARKLSLPVFVHDFVMTHVEPNKKKQRLEQ